MHPFSSPWKHQKTVGFSDIFRGKRKCTAKKWVKWRYTGLIHLYALFIGVVNVRFEKKGENVLCFALPTDCSYCKDKERFKNYLVAIDAWKDVKSSHRFVFLVLEVLTNHFNTLCQCAYMPFVSGQTRVYFLSSDWLSGRNDVTSDKVNSIPDFRQFKKIKIIIRISRVCGAFKQFKATVPW